MFCSPETGGASLRGELAWPIRHAFCGGSGFAKSTNPVSQSRQDYPLTML